MKAQINSEVNYLKSIPENVLERLPAFIEMAIKEDVGPGDYSSLSSIESQNISNARLLVKQDCILAGLSFAFYLFHFIDPEIEFKGIMEDGQCAKKGDIAFTIKGNTQTILKLERLCLNVMQRMSGIATQTNQFVEALKGTGTEILDTRKTTPMMRFLEKWGVKIGGGKNHRFGLYDMIMLKDNHIDAAGGIQKAIQKAKEYKNTHQLNIPIEVETRSLEDISIALNEGGIDVIMLDNFTPEMCLEAKKIIQGKVKTEISGGITLENIMDYTNAGVDYISTSQITHSIKAIDLSLKIF